MSYQVVIKKSAFKSLQSIPNPYFLQVKTTIYSLVDNPRPIGYKKLKGRTGFRIRVANYRIIYEIQDKILLIEVVAIGRRNDIYE